jgi:hypothetical protein
MKKQNKDQTTQGNNLVEVSTGLKRIVEDTKVYINSKIEKFIIPTNNEILLDDKKYQLLFFFDRTRLVFDRQVVGNVKDGRTKLGIRELTGDQINQLLNQL